MADVPAIVPTNTPLTTVYETTNAVDFSADLTEDHESEVPLLALVNRLRSEKATEKEYKFAVSRFMPRTSTTTSAVAATGVGVSATIPVASGSYFNAGDVIEVPDVNDDSTHTSQFYITAVSTNDLTARPYKPATYGCSAIASGATVRVLFSATEESSDGRYSHLTVPTVYTQYIQIFEDYFSVGNIQQASKQYTTPAAVRGREEKRKKHAVDQEYAMYLALGVEDTSTTAKPRRQMYGLKSQLTSNVFTYGDALEKGELWKAMTQIHNPAYSGGNKRLIISSGNFLGQVNDLASDSIRTTTRESKWGPDITDVQFAGKVWSFVEAPVLSAARPGYAFILQPMFLKKRVLIPTTYRMNVQSPKSNYNEHGFITAMALETRLEEAMGYFKE